MAEMLAVYKLIFDGQHFPKKKIKCEETVAEIIAELTALNDTLLPGGHTCDTEAEKSSEERRKSGQRNSQMSQCKPQ
ncbi:unnamed protein product [Ceutorhynchus assimilis]|uniref:Uncharacterized protein n=1 Tax=Ceutorhynchus assimilis TaxID=467358 RepID=A0A9N9QI25_9CUCU|nr:unnamed protein product [Ceutorhynchus assimilis]